MSRASGSGSGRQAIAAYRRELLERLGLQDGASDQDIEKAHDALSEFLAGAPSPVSGWAEPRRREVDEAFALLSGPPEAMAESALDQVMAARAVVPATPAKSKSGQQSLVADESRTSFPWVPVGIIAVVAGIIFGVWWMGRDPGVPDLPASAQSSSSPAADAGIDQQRVMQLMQNISEDPKDVPSLRELGGIYFNAGDVATAQSWYEKILAVKPDDRDAALNLGLCYYNQDQRPKAQALWSKTAQAYPRDPGVHFYLGFYYFAQDPRDEAKMKAEWNKVVELDPTSEWAKSAKAHLASLKSGS